jgi:hypothetical protein
MTLFASGCGGATLRSDGGSDTAAPEPDGGPDTAAPEPDGGPDTAAPEPDGGSPFACGPTPIPIPIEGGTRLRPRVLVDEAGVVFPYGIVDVTTGSGCSLVVLTDGTLLCARPGDYPACAPGITGVVLQRELADVGDGLAVELFRGEDGSRVAFDTFQDLDRDVAVGIDTLNVGGSWLVPRLRAAPPTSLTDSPDACAPTASSSGLYFQYIGCNPITDDETYVRAATPNSAHPDQTFSTEPVDVTGFVCRPQAEGGQAAVAVQWHALHVTAEVPLESWKQAAPARFGTGRYGLGGWQAGCVFVPGVNYRLFDSQLDDEPCFPTTASDQMVRCLPTNVGWIGFADAACTQKMMFTDSSQPVPRYYADGSLLVGAYSGPIGLVGAQLPRVDLIYQSRGPGQCFPSVTNQGNWVAYELGPVVPVETFGAMQIEVR